MDKRNNYISLTVNWTAEAQCECVCVERDDYPVCSSTEKQTQNKYVEYKKARATGHWPDWK